MTGMDAMANDWGWMNLKQKPQIQNLNGAKTAIVTTPEKARALINMNNQLAHPYQIKGAYLI